MLFIFLRKQLSLKIYTEINNKFEKICLKYVGQKMLKNNSGNSMCKFMVFYLLISILPFSNENPLEIQYIA